MTTIFIALFVLSCVAYLLSPDMPIGIPLSILALTVISYASDRFVASDEAAQNTAATPAQQQRLLVGTWLKGVALIVAGLAVIGFLIYILGTMTP